MADKEKQKDAEFFLEDGIESDEDGEASVTFDSSEEDERGDDVEEGPGLHQPSSYNSQQWPQSFRETMDSYTISMPPSFGMLGPSPIRSIFESNYSKNNLGVDARSLLLADFKPTNRRRIRPECPDCTQPCQLNHLQFIARWQGNFLLVMDVASLKLSSMESNGWSWTSFYTIYN